MIVSSIYGIPVTNVYELPADLRPKDIVLDEQGQPIDNQGEIPYMLPNGEFVWFNPLTMGIDEQSKQKCMKYLAEKALESLRPKLEMKVEPFDLYDQIMWRARLRYGGSPYTGVSYVVPTGDLS